MPMPETTSYEGHAAIDTLFDDQAAKDEGEQKLGEQPKTAETQKPDEKPKTVETQKLDEKPNEEDDDSSMPRRKETSATKPAPKPVQNDAPKLNTPKELREAYSSQSETLKKITAELEDAKKALAVAREEGEKAAAEKIKAEIEELKKERQELTTKVAFTDFTQSKEYETQFINPIKDLWKTIQSEIADWTFQDEEDQPVKVTTDHVMQLLRMNTPAAAAQAQKMFGAAASEFMAHRRTLIDLYTKRDNAVNEWKEKGSKLKEDRDRQLQDEARSTVETFDKRIKEYSSNRPDVFGEPQDAEEKKFFLEGQKIVDMAFRGTGIKDGLTPEQRRTAIVHAQANVAAKAAMFGAILMRLEKRDSEIEALKAKLAQFEGTEPTEGDVSKHDEKGGSRSKDLSPLDAIDAIEGI